MTIITLTRFPEIFEIFAQSVEKWEPNHRRIVVTSGGANVYRFGWETIVGPEPFNFARNLNLGIGAAGQDDVLASNDDVELVEPVIDNLYGDCDDRTAIITPQVIGDGINHPWAHASFEMPARYLDTKKVIPFVCVLLKRSALDDLGPLDEGFNGYAGEDEEYGLRALRRGWKLRVSGRTRVKHGYGADTYSSTFHRVMTKQERDSTMMRNRRRAQEMNK